MTREEYIRQVILEYVIVLGPMLLVGLIVGLWVYDNPRREIPAAFIMLAAGCAWLYLLFKFA